MESEPLELPPGGLDDGVVAVRSYRVEDAPLLAEGARDEAVVRFAFVRWGSDPPERIAQRISEDWPALARAGRVLNVSIRDSGTDELLGHFVIFGVDRVTGVCEIGYWLRPEARGRGVATRAVALVCRWVFDTLEIFRIQASADVENVASHRTLERNGFRREGILRSLLPAVGGGRVDHVLFSRLATDAEGSGGAGL